MCEKQPNNTSCLSDSLHSSSLSSLSSFFNDSDSEETLDHRIVRKESNAVKKVLDNELFSFDVVSFSEKLVCATFIEAGKDLYLDRERHLITVADFLFPLIESIINRALSSESSDPAFVANESSDASVSQWSNSSIVWPKVSEFNIKMGLEKLEEYVNTWQRQCDWQFCVEFLGFESEDCSNVFVYEVKWSKPTKSYPVPQATASAYFALEVFKMIPYKYPRAIEISYVFEASNFIHRPGRVDFQEKFLEDIIEAKLKFFKTVTFGVPKGYC